jgi:hypothetical protein
MELTRTAVPVPAGKADGSYARQSVGAFLLPVPTRLMEDGEYRRAAIDALGSVVAALAATFLGFAIAREVIAWRERF